MADTLLQEPHTRPPEAPAGAPEERGAMKLLSCFIRPEQLDAVTAALDALGVGGITVTDVRGFGRQKGQVEHYRGGEYTIRFIPKVRLEVAVRAQEVDRVMAAIHSAGRTGQVGDGKLFVTELRNVVRIRTGERGTGAL